jgi:CheY-like chemotaxis protein/GAF domain-containing protein
MFVTTDHHGIEQQAQHLRSLNDFCSDEEVEHALRKVCRKNCVCSGCSSAQQQSRVERQDSSTSTSTATTTASFESECSADWFLPNCAKETSLPQTVEDELRRLKALKSFQILEAAQKSGPVVNSSSNSDGRGISNAEAVDIASTISTMDRLVDLATRMFDVPVAVLSLTDLGRMYVLAQSGLGDILELPRREAICAHAVLCTQDAFVVTDISKDARFSHLSLPEKASRFYAGAPLITPEGDRIGAMCILDSKPRPEGLTATQCKDLSHFAGLAMDALVERRSRLHQARKLQKASRVISSTVHDLLTPLTAVELALSLLHEDQDFQSKLLEHQKESVKIASNCVGVLGKMCRTLRDQNSASCNRTMEGSSSAQRSRRSSNPDFGLTAASFHIMYGTDATDSEGEEDTSSSLENKAMSASRVPVVVKDLVKSIHMAMDAVPKHNTISIALHSSVPHRIIADDLKVLRCSLNLLQHCASVAKCGSSIRLSINNKKCKCGKAMLCFHCGNRQDTPCCLEETSPCASQCCCHSNARITQSLQGCSNVNLYSIAMQMEAMGGDCGIQRGSEADECSIWFRIPLEQPVEELQTSQLPISSKERPVILDGATSIPCREEADKQNSNVDMTLVLEAQPRRRRALIIEDSIVIRKVIANALSKIGFDAVTACNGMEGLHMLQRSLYDVVLCDFLMPVMDGLDCVAQYRQWEKTHRQWLRQYIIGMSAHASDQDVEHGLRVGMDCYKPKPLTYQGLKDLVEACERNEQNLITGTLDNVDKNPLSCKVDQNRVLSDCGLKQPRMCLIATKDDAFDLSRLAEARGWKSLIVHDGDEALQALKKRNWDSVLLDEKLPLLTGKRCATEFRAWERENRVNSQKNIFIMTSKPNDDENPVKVPEGADGVLRKTLRPADFEKMLEMAEEESTLYIIMR